MLAVLAGGDVARKRGQLVELVADRSLPPRGRAQT